jgi:molybdopterin converting factor small subunit
MPPRLTREHPLASAGAINVSVPTPLRNCCAGASELALIATDVRGVLEELERSYPALHRSICDETGAVRRHINLFVNTQHMRDFNGLDTSLESGDVVTIMTAVSGG